MRSNSVLSCLLILAVLCGACRRRYPDYAASSGFDRTEIDSMTLGNLEVLGRVWGYVKYHHPVFSNNKRFDIDYELFGLLPKVADVDPTIRNRVLAEWIDGLGEYTVDKVRYDTLPPNPLAHPVIDLDWTQDTVCLGSELSERMVRLRYADRQDNYYATKTVYDAAYFNKYFPSKDIPENFKAFEVKQAFFGNERAYSNLKELDYGFRLLAVFRFWNMVEYFFPSKHMTDKAWCEVLPEYIGRMASLPDGDYQHTMWRMITEIDDSHASAAPWLFGSSRVPLYTAFVEGRLIVTRPDTAYHFRTSEAGFALGDEIVAVYGRPLSYYIAQACTYIPHSNTPRVYANAADIILRTAKNTKIPIRYRRGKIVRDTLAAVVSRFQNDQHRYYGNYADLGNGICYVNPGRYVNDDEAPLREMVDHAKGLIIDFRNYPSQDFMTLIGQWLTPDSLSKMLYSRYTYPSLSLPGVFLASEEPEAEWRRPCEGTFPLVIIVDNGTQSAAEACVQLLQTRHDVIVIGNQTAGANGDISVIDLPGGIRTCFSGLGWFYSDGRPGQRQGVRIDVEVQPTIEGISAGRDELLDRAVHILTEAPENLKKSRED